MSKMLGRAALAAATAVTLLSLAVSAAEGRDTDRSAFGAADAARSASAPINGERGSELQAPRGMDGAPVAAPSRHPRRAPRRFDAKVAPRPDCELGLHGCFVRNGDRHGVF